MKKMCFVVVLALFGYAFGVNFNAGNGSAGSPWQISTEAQLLKVNENTDACYILVNNINIAGTYSDALISAGEFVNYVFNGSAFGGTFDGNGYSVQNMTIAGGSSNNVALFGYVNASGVVKNLGIENATVSGAECVGTIVGRSSGFITNCYALGSPSVVGVSGNRYVGGLIGISQAGSVIDCWVNVGVLSVDRVGGLMGQNSAAVTNCHASGNVAATASSALNHAGGFVGWQEANTIRNCYATGDVTGYGFRIGGFAGQLNGGTIAKCYATGNASHIGTSVGIVYVGGLVGLAVGNISECYATGDVDSGTGDRAGGLVAQASGLVTDCYATGNVSGTNIVGGLVGITGDSDVQVNNCYATGTVTGASYVGAVVGWRYRGAINTCFWDSETSGTSVGVGSGGGDATGKTNAEMKTESTFTGAGWDFTDVWYMSSPSSDFAGYPALEMEYVLWGALEKGDLLWSEELGLWSTVVGDTRKHSSWFTTSTLLLAGRYGILNDSRVESVLQGLYEMQNSNGAIKSYYEDPGIADYNMSFFVCRGLLLLRHAYASELGVDALAKLDQVLNKFYGHLYYLAMLYNVRYPNAYLGQMICTKLIQELYAMTGPEVADIELKMLEAAQYWRDNEWGWGEHLSDTYAGVSVDFISEYLLFTNDDSQSQIYSEYEDLMAELLFIEDSVGTGPRVPAIRSYAFSGRSIRINYRDTVVPWRDSMALTLNHFYRESYLMHALYYEKGWTDIQPPVSPVATNMSVACFDGAVATGYIEDNIRLGSMSNYPIMDGIEHLTWGLSWQCYPVTLWKPQGDWAFLQWQTVEDGQVRAHPANYNGGPVALTLSVDPPYVGETYSYQNGGNVLVVRIMPQIAGSWQSVSDLFKLTNRTASVESCPLGAGFEQLLLKYADRTVSVGMIPITGQPFPRMWYEDNTLYWGTFCSGTELAAQETHAVINLWGISLDGEITRGPHIEVVEPIDPSRTEAMQKRNIKWAWPNGEVWCVQIDPLSEDVIDVYDIFPLNQADFNVDGSVDILDLTRFVSEWLQ